MIRRIRMAKIRKALAIIIFFALDSLNTQANTNTWGVCLHTRYQSSNIYHSPATVAAVRGTLAANETVKADFKEGKWYAVFKPSETVRSITNTVGYMMEEDLFQLPLPPGPITGGVGEAPPVNVSIEKMSSIPVIKKNSFIPIASYLNTARTQEDTPTAKKEPRQYYEEKPIKKTPYPVMEPLEIVEDKSVAVEKPTITIKKQIAEQTTVYSTKVIKDENDVLMLANGGIVKINFGFLGYLGFQKDAVLFKDGITWKVWIKGKRIYSCDIIKAPSRPSTERGERVYISEVLGNGKILKMLSGDIYTVGDLNVIETTLWLGNTDALLIEGKRLINFNDTDDIIDVTKLSD
jgi:hypothetical protein